MQNITIAGRVGRDAELRTTQAGDRVCSFSVAVDARDGREKITNWWRVSLWGKRGEAVSPYLLKGASVTVSGEFSLNEYDGKPQLNIRANEIALQGGRSGESQRQDNGAQRSERREPEGKAQRGGGGGDHSRGGWGDDLDDDIPFATNQGIW